MHFENICDAAARGVHFVVRFAQRPFSLRFINDFNPRAPIHNPRLDALEAFKAPSCYDHTIRGGAVPVGVAVVSAHAKTATASKSNLNR